MKNFKIIELKKLSDTVNYQPIEAGIFNDINDKGGFATHRIAMSLELEEGEDDQYPLEDILDEYLVHVEEFLDKEGNAHCYIFGGELDDLQKLKLLVGKRAYNEEFVDEDGQTRVKLVVK